ncbi:MAG TPA: FAD-dependent oxidoreductase, partial [Thermomicrobiales bacterium]|nr:FAD-dependent oxidoreductase [Thermomicrobiales bacterium]
MAHDRQAATTATATATTFEPRPAKPHVVIIGGGFGGLNAARALNGAPVEVTVIDRRNHHLFQPLLYQVATASLSPADIAAPIRGVLRKQPDLRVLLAEATEIQPEQRLVKLDDGSTVPYDYLILAAGSRHSYFGHDEWEQYAPGLKNLEDAIAIRRRILLAFEEAERTADEAAQQRLLTFVVVGGGPTGVELAGALGEIAHYSLARDFDTIDPSSAKIYLLEAGPRILATFPDKLARKARSFLQDLGV